MELVSIITPAYNSEDFIERAVKSVIEQTYSNWEMLIISDDKKDYKEILFNKGIEDPRLRFFTTGKIGSGPATARNVGLKQSKGQYITLLDSDDEYVNTRLEILLPLARKHKVVADNISYIDEKTKKEYGTLFNESFFADITEAINNIRGKPFLFIRRDIITFTWDPDILLSEDFVFNCSVFNNIDKIFISEQCLYKYYFRYGSLSHSEESYEEILSAFETMLKKAKNKTISIKGEKTLEFFVQYVNKGIDDSKERIKIIQKHGYERFKQFSQFFKDFDSIKKDT